MVEARRDDAPAVAVVDAPGHDQGVPSVLQEHDEVYHPLGVEGKEPPRRIMPRSAPSSADRSAAAAAA
jgi:hypothetical protein